MSDPSMPVPTFHPEDGAESHSHSPRRRSLLNRASASHSFSMPLMPNLINPQATTINPAVFPQTVQTLQRQAVPSGSGFPDPFTETAYLEWVNSLGLAQNADSGDARAVWPPFFARNSSKQSSTDISMPDYLSSQSGQNVGPESMLMSGTSLEDEMQVGSLKVPTNTPTGGPGEASSGLGMLFLPRRLVPVSLLTPEQSLLPSISRTPLSLES